MLEMRWNSACQVLYSLRSTQTFRGSAGPLDFPSKEMFLHLLASYHLLGSLIKNLWGHRSMKSHLVILLNAAIPICKLKLRLYPDC